MFSQSPKLSQVATTLPGRPLSCTALSAPHSLLNTEVKGVKESRNTEAEQKVLGVKLIVYVEQEQGQREGNPYVWSAYYVQRTFMYVLPNLCHAII